MNNLQVKNRGGSLWFVLGALFIGLAIIAASFARGNYAWLPSTLIGVIGIVAILWGLFGAKRFIEFGDVGGTAGLVFSIVNLVRYIRARHSQVAARA